MPTQLLRSVLLSPLPVEASISRPSSPQLWTMNPSMRLLFASRVSAAVAAAAPGSLPSSCTIGSLTNPGCVVASMLTVWTMSLYGAVGAIVQIPPL